MKFIWLAFISMQKRPPNGRDKNVGGIFEGFCEALPGEEASVKASQGALFKSRTLEVLLRHLSTKLIMYFFDIKILIHD